ncbi:MAG: UDP-N-acetylglucosamine 2-epimerase (hydrolyzing) [Bacteroidetes bacterium]|nr:MAG: UDP-N-acetylglucosamine 2-epimerase (hydrolyzing) [Bacteroidota bacterium]
MKIGILTSSRADFGIYTPLINELYNDSFFDTKIIAFGTHLSDKFGLTYKQIEKSGFTVNHKIETIPNGDLPFDISKSIAKTIDKFSEFWNNNKFDIVFALGDRYEMFAAVSAASPFNIKIAHIHGGETTLGAIDNAYRHSISLFSKIHFTTTEQYKNRVTELIENNKNVYNVGALSIDNLTKINFYSISEFKTEFKIDLSIPTILMTFHPETVSFEKNKTYINELLSAINKIKKYQIVITMPNADTMGLHIRNEINNFAKTHNNFIAVENFGVRGYLSSMKYCSFMLGNTSSGFVEAAYFPKYVINLGKRQQGRIITKNIINCEIKTDKILSAIKQVEQSKLPENVNIYGKGDTAKQIVKILKSKI